MGEFEDKLNSILSSPKDMEKILGLARELSGSLGGGDEQKDTAAAEVSPKQQSPGFDPKLLSLFTRLMGAGFLSSKHLTWHTGKSSGSA